MKTLKKHTKKPLTAKQKESIMTAFGTVMIITLTITSAFSFDVRNERILQAMNQKFETIHKG